MSLKYKLIIFFIIICIIPAATIIYIYQKSTSKLLIDKNTQYSISMSDNKTDSMDRLFGDIEKALLSICTSSKTMNYLELVNSGNYYEDEMYLLTSEVGEKLDTFLDLYQEIDSIYIMPDNDELPIFRGDLNLKYTNNFSEQSAYIQSVKNPERIIWELKPGASNGEFELTISKGIVNGYNDKILGVLVISQKIKNLFTNLQTANTNDGEFVLVMDENKQIIYRDKSGNTNPELERELLQADKEAENGNFEIEIKKDVYLITYTTSEINGWRIYYITPKDNILRGINNILKHTWIISIFFAICAIIAAGYVFIILYKPIKKLTDAMDKIEDGNLDMEVNITSSDELGILSGKFNYLIGQIKTLINDVKEDQKKKSELEIKALQAQIMPHFLYNTLNCVISLARLNKTPIIIDMVSALIDLLRVSANNQVSIITVNEEIKYVKSYVLIMSYRYDIPFHISYDIEAGLENIEIQKFSIQPIVENSIIHAFNGGQDKCEINISIYSDHEYVKVRVSDNGAGIDQNSLNEINRRIADETAAKQRFSGIGIENVHNRLLAEYGSPSGICIESKVGEGTTVTITFPKKDQTDS